MRRVRLPSLLKHVASMFYYRYVPLQGPLNYFPTNPDTKMFKRAKRKLCNDVNRIYFLCNCSQFDLFNGLTVQN